jgi:hypothetical protein
VQIYDKEIAVVNFQLCFLVDFLLQLSFQARQIGVVYPGFVKPPFSLHKVLESELLFIDTAHAFKVYDVAPWNDLREQPVEHVSADSFGQCLHVAVDQLLLVEAVDRSEVWHVGE